MFSSNQVLEISGTLSLPGELESALEFALKYSDSYKNMLQEEIDRGCKLLYQITEDGRYCIGWGFETVPSGWNEYPSTYDIDTICCIIRHHLASFSIKEDFGDGGSYLKGFIMQRIGESLAVEKDGIKEPFYGIVCFKPYTCFYSK